MQITLLEHIPAEELLKRVRAIPLMRPKEAPADFQPVLPYEEAELSFRTVWPDELNPTSFYALRGKLSFLRELQGELARQGHDLFNLDGGLILKGETKNWTLTPPVVEHVFEKVVFQNATGDLAYSSPFKVGLPIINDGLHRVYLAREQKKMIKVIHICRHWNPHHPFYAYPNAWEEVKIVEEVPSNPADKKLYRRDDCYSLFRDFGVLGCGAPRAAGLKF